MVKPPLVVAGMWGVGDVIHQRAVLRELMKTRDVWLETFSCAMYHDLIEQGLKIVQLTTKPPRMREATLSPRYVRPPPNVSRMKITYNRDMIGKTGSIIASQFATCGLLPLSPDFSMPIPQDWRDKARRLISTWDMRGKPLLIYRPIVLNDVWNCPSRSPDPHAYAALFKRVCSQFFVVSIADLKPEREWIVDPEQDADVKLHAGELDFETLAALFAEADMIFGNAGFTPVLAQAVGTPSITVYGGHESAKTTQQQGAHLAPSLFIEPITPCDCHRFDHDCDKTIALGPAHTRVEQFIDKHIQRRPRALIFATTYVDDANKAKLLDHWLTLNIRQNSDCDILIVDSQSPLPLIDAKHDTFDAHMPGLRARRMLHSFPDNIGHLARGGRDGWGRAFCYGLEAAISGDYEFAVHVEGDSLFRLPVGKIVDKLDGVNCASVPVVGTKRVESGWVETGLMFWRTKYLTDSSFVERYDWQHRTPVPTPEAVVHQLLGADLRLMDWRGVRDDLHMITDVTQFDWITHCSDMRAYDRFMAALDPPPPAPVKLNFGCGENVIDGWENYDAEIDISKPLPFPDNHADFIFTEHCIEHIDYYSAISFLKECRRVLKPGAVVRITTPSIEQVWKTGDQRYFDFTTKWQPDATARGAMHALLYCHGHKTAWTASLLEASVYLAGFKNVTQCAPGQSAHMTLRGIEGHHKIIGEHANTLESIVFEGNADK